MSGFVYLATNESMQGLVKIGMTKKPIEHRIEELSNETGTPTPFACPFFLEVDNPNEVEIRLHDLFKYCRVNSKKEFFAVDWRAVMVALLLLVKSPDESVKEMKKISDKNKEQPLITDEMIKAIQREVKRALISPTPPRSAPPPDIAEQYKEYVRSKVGRPITAETYHNALLHLDKHRDETYIDKNIYDIESVQEAQKIKDRLSLGGDLHKFNVDFQASAMGAAIGKYIEFLKQKSEQ